MDKASDDVADIFGGGLEFEVFTPQGIKVAKPAAGGQPRTDLKTLLFYTPKGDRDPAKRGRRDGLGTTPKGRHPADGDERRHVGHRRQLPLPRRDQHLRQPGRRCSPRSARPIRCSTGIALARRGSGIGVGDRRGDVRPHPQGATWWVVPRPSRRPRWAGTGSPWGVEQQGLQVGPRLAARRRAWRP